MRTQVTNRAWIVLTILLVGTSPATSRGDFDEFTSNPEGICLGRLHLVGLEPGAVTLGRPAVAANEKSRPITIAVSGSSLFVYRSGSLRESDRPCTSSGSAKTHAVIQGNIASGTIKGTLVQRNGGSAELHIDKSGFDLTIANAKLNPEKIYGGTLQANTAFLHLTNAQREIVSGGRTVKGAVQFAVKGSAIENAILTLGGARTAVALRAAPDEPSAFTMDLSNGSLQLDEGTLATPGSMRLSPGRARLAGLDVDYSQGQARGLEIAATSRRVKVEMRSLTLRAVSAAHEQTPRVSAKAGGDFKIASISGLVPHDNSALAIQAPNLQGVVFSAAAMSIGTAIGGTEPIRAAGTLRIEELTDTLARGTLSLSTPAFAFLPPAMVGTRVKELALSFRGEKSALAIDGALSVSSIGLGAVLLTDVAVQGRLTAHGSTAFDIELTGAAGRMDVSESVARARILYTGMLAALKLKGLAEVAPTDGRNFLTIPQDQLAASLVNMESRAPCLFGGELAAERLALTNATPIAAGPQLEGRLRLSTDLLTIKKAQLSLGGATRTAVALRVPAGVPVVSTLGLSDGTLRLDEGTLAAAGPIALSPGQARLAGLDVTYSQGQAEALEVTAISQRIKVGLRNLTVRATSAAHEQTPRVLAGAGGDLKITAISGLVPQDNGALTIQVPNLQGVGFSSSAMSIGAATGGTAPIRAAGTLAIEELTETLARGTISLSSPAFAFLPPALVGTLVKGLALSFRGEKSALAIDGSLSVSSIALGAVLLADVAVQGRFTAHGNTAFDIELTGTAGRMEVFESVARARLLYTGTLAALKLKALAEIAPSDGRSFLTIPQDQLTASLVNLESRAPSLFGGELAAEGLTLTSATALVAGPQLEGRLRMSTDRLTLKNAKAAISPGGPVASLAAMAASTLTVLVIEPAAGRVLLEAGDFTASSLRIAAHTFEVAGLSITPADLSVRTLAIAARQGIADVKLAAIEVATGRTEHTATPHFAGTLREPARINEARGQVPMDGNPLAVHRLDISGVTLQLSDAFYESSDSFKVKNASAEVSLARLTPTSITGHLLLTTGVVAFNSQGGQGSIAIRGFTLDFDGEKAHVRGTGRLTVDRFQVKAEVGAPIFRCGAHTLPLAIFADAAQTTGSVTVVEGRLTASLDVAAVNAIVQKVGGTFECEWDVPLHVEAPRIPLVYPCPKLYKPWDWCSGWTYAFPNIDMSIRMIARIVELAAAGHLEALSLRAEGSGGLRLCGGHLRGVALLRPAILSVNPTIPGGNILFEAARQALNTISLAAESAFITSVAEIASLLNAAGVGENANLFGSCG